MLKRARIDISPSSVHRKLKASKYSLRGNRKSLSMRQSPDRNKQFEIINATRDTFLKKGWAVISVDAKHRELVGPFKNAGREWRRTPRDVSISDYPSDASGIAIPYGIYDLAQQDGFVVVGTSGNTPGFSVNAIKTWWSAVGRRLYAKCSRLLILADGGGSNGARAKKWKAELQAFATAQRLKITVAHYPSGASKWNPVEHRLFSAISINWAAQPLVDYRTICGFISRTRTGSGRRCHVRLDRKVWLTEKQRVERGVPPKDLPVPKIRHSTDLPKWNYTMRP